MELLPCPWCNNPALFQDRIGKAAPRYWVICPRDEYGHGHVAAETPELAIQRWNTRHTPPTEWRDISSAKQGENVRVWSAEEGQRDAYLASDLTWRPSAYSSVQLHPTHWQPIPLPPTQPDTNKEEV